VLGIVVSGRDHATDGLLADPRLRKLTFTGSEAVGRHLRNGGAACTAANRFYVERPVAEEFTRRPAARLGAFRLGRGTRRGATLGPMMHEEAFGPVAPVASFDDEDRVLSRANDRGQGLAGYVHTRDLERAMRVAARLEAGMVAVNRGRVSSAAASFGGVRRSGFGSSGGPEGLAEYLTTRYVALPEA